MKKRTARRSIIKNSCKANVTNGGPDPDQLQPSTLQNNQCYFNYIHIFFKIISNSIKKRIY